MQNLIPRGLRRSKYNEQIINCNELNKLTESQYENIEAFFGQQVRVISGFVDTQYGLELTSKRVMDTMKELQAIRQVKQRDQEIMNIERNSRLNIEMQDKRKFAKRIAISKMYDRQRRFGMELVLPRSFKQRRIDAKRIVLKKEKEMLDLVLN